MASPLKPTMTVIVGPTPNTAEPPTVTSSAVNPVTPSLKSMSKTSGKSSEVADCPEPSDTATVGTVSSRMLVSDVPVAEFPALSVETIEAVIRPSASPLRSIVVALLTDPVYVAVSPLISVNVTTALASLSKPATVNSALASSVASMNPSPSLIVTDRFGAASATVSLSLVSLADAEFPAPSMAVIAAVMLPSGSELRLAEKVPSPPTLAVTVAPPPLLVNSMVPSASASNPATVKLTLDSSDVLMNPSPSLIVIDRFAAASAVVSFVLVSLVPVAEFPAVSVAVIAAVIVPSLSELRSMDVEPSAVMAEVIAAPPPELENVTMASASTSSPATVKLTLESSDELMKPSPPSSIVTDRSPRPSAVVSLRNPWTSAGPVGMPNPSNSTAEKFENPSGVELILIPDAEKSPDPSAVTVSVPVIPGPEIPTLEPGVAPSPTMTTFACSAALTVKSAPPIPKISTASNFLSSSDS